MAATASVTPFFFGACIPVRLRPRGRDSRLACVAFVFLIHGVGITVSSLPIGSVPLDREADQRVPGQGRGKLTLHRRAGHLR